MQGSTWSELDISPPLSEALFLLLVAPPHRYNPSKMGR